MNKEKITLYSTNCTRCKILEAKLNNANIKYEINNDVDYMISKGFLTAPMLEIDGVVYDFTNANEWVNRRSNEGVN